MLRPGSGGFFAPFSIALKLTFRFHGNMTMSSVVVGFMSPLNDSVGDLALHIDRSDLICRGYDAASLLAIALRSNFVCAPERASVECTSISPPVWEAGKSAWTTPRFPVAVRERCGNKDRRGGLEPPKFFCPNFDGLPLHVRDLPTVSLHQDPSWREENTTRFDWTRPEFWGRFEVATIIGAP